jgi:hypothetical protein
LELFRVNRGYVNPLNIGKSNVNLKQTVIRGVQNGYTGIFGGDTVSGWRDVDFSKNEYHSFFKKRLHGEKIPRLAFVSFDRILNVLIFLKKKLSMRTMIFFL